MELEKQVCSLELAKRLKELGVKQYPATFYWTNRYKKEYELMYQPVHQMKYLVAAFTVAELGELLPTYILNGEDRKFLYCYSDDIGFWRVTYAKWGQPGIAVEKRRNEADVRALMLIMLIEKGLADGSK